MKTIAMPNGTKVPLTELIKNAEREIVRQNYCKGTISHYKSVWKKFLDYANKESDGEYFNEKLGRRFLKEIYGFYPEMPINDNPQAYRQKRRAIRILGDLQLHGLILRHEMSENVPYPPQFKQIMEDYLQYLKSQYISDLTIRTKEPQLKRFVRYLNEMMVDDLKNITHQHISGFTETLSGYNPKTYNSFMVTIRQFLRYLYQNDIISNDLTNLIVQAPVYKNTDIPSAFSYDEVRKIISCIDRSSKIGKRDYAIVMLAANLGIRAGDIRNLKLSDINWKNKEINFIQSKTKIPLSLPLDDETGWAIIEYLKYARPQTECKNIFVRFNAPFEAYSDKNTFYSAIQKYFSAANINFDRNHKHGIHSLRHSLASALLEKHIPLPIISGILGHSDFNSTMTYLKTDLENLKQCVIDPEEVMNYEA